MMMRTVSILFSNFLMNSFHTELYFITLKSWRKCNCIVVLARIRSFDLSHITFGQLIVCMSLGNFLFNISQGRSKILCKKIRYVTISLRFIYCHKLEYKNFPLYVLLSSFDIAMLVLMDVSSSNFDFVSISEKIKWLISIWEPQQFYCNDMIEKISAPFYT